ncbi:hypothetical protein L3Y34_012862 [Caenorhabditis briggsae]|uniref:Uncharacterized protein n=1 Tax=Caenorhabditis briggsae TaxID=6238 RepID=A0AAE9CWD4_CAEBR|nr:hypothetical protein L3Y34_012862 [Caenorhabditis briggsae]
MRAFTRHPAFVYRNSSEWQDEEKETESLEMTRIFEKEYSTILSSRRSADDNGNPIEYLNESREEEVRDDNGDSRCLRIQRSPAKQQKTNTTDSYEPLDIESFYQRLDAKML